MNWTSGAQPPRRDRVQRDGERKLTNKPAILHYNGTRLPVMLKDISRSGSKLALDLRRANAEIGDKAELEIPGFLKLPVATRWRSSAVVGVEFDVPKSRKATLDMQINRTFSGRKR